MTFDELVSLYQSTDSAPHPALKGLNTVDWSAVHDAYGPATSVPALIRALVSCEPTHRAYAIEALLQHIWHQGTVYSATADAVPILFDLLESEATPDRSAIAVLLAAIADGEPPFKRCEDDAEEAQRWRKILSRSNRSLDAELEAGRQYGSAIRERISAGLDSLSPYLRDPDPEVRRSVAIAMGRFPAVVNRMRPELEAALDAEPDASVRDAIREALQCQTER